MNKFKYGSNIYEHKNSKPNEPHKFVLNLTQRLDLRISNKHDAPQNLFIYYMWKNIRQKYKDNKLRIIAPTWNVKIQLPKNSYSVSNIQDYIEYIMKNTK